MGIKRRRGRLVLFLLGAIAIGAATAAVVRRRLAGPTPFPPGPVMPKSQSASAPPPPPPPPVQPSAAHAPDVVSDPEMDPSSEGGPALSQDQANTFFDQVMAETAAENPEPEAPTR